MTDSLRSSSDRDHLRRRNSSENLDRFIPNRSAMDMDYAHYMLTEGNKRRENPARVLSASTLAYRKLLADALNMNRTRILAFRNKPHTEVAHPIAVEALSAPNRSTPWHRCRHIPQSPERVLDAPDVMDDFYLNVLDWGCNNVVAVGLSNAVYLWDASDGSTSELVTIEEDDGPVTSINWSPSGQHIAIGLNNSHVVIWDYISNKKLRTLRVCHQSRVSALAWKNHILSTGGMDGRVVNNDVRVRDHIVGIYRGHQQEVCGLKWSTSGQHLASGGNDRLLFVWDKSMMTSNSPVQYLQRLDDHRAAVKALAWCPFQPNLLASGGGFGDHLIKFWNTNTGACLNSVDTGSQVSALLWSKHERELLSSHGFSRNHLTLWKYPSLLRTAELFGHTSRVLHMTQSPDGYAVATLAADETLRIWNVFGSPEKAKPAPKENHEPFAQWSHIR